MSDYTWHNVEDTSEYPDELDDETVSFVADVLNANARQEIESARTVMEAISDGIRNGQGMAEYEPLRLACYVLSHLRGAGFVIVHESSLTDLASQLQALTGGVR